MRLDAHGIAIVDVRDERAAVHMAQAHAELTGDLGVALVTAGPGVTNAMTRIANAFVSRAPVLVIAGTNPRPQENRGGLQDLDHTHLVRTITRYARTVREPSLALAELDEAIARAFGEARRRAAKPRLVRAGAVMAGNRFFEFLIAPQTCFNIRSGSAMACAMPAASNLRAGWAPSSRQENRPWPPCRKPRAR
jgi:glyoxylate carboligase